MGYQSGTGLGTRSQGIVNPIESFVYPTGKSLDTCFTLKAESERKKLDIGEVLKEKAKKLRLEAKRARQYQKTVEKSQKKAENSSVFRFIDDMFHSSSSSSMQSSKRLKIRGENSSGKFKNQAKNLDAKSLSLSAFKVDEELKKAEAELRRYEESFRRNSSSKSGPKSGSEGDLGLKTIQQKRDRARAVVDGLRKRQAELGRETALRKDKQKMMF